MTPRIVSTLGWKLAAALALVAVGLLGLGGTTIATSLVKDEDGVAETTEDDLDDADAAEHPENFGAVVSADARDGGVDGQEISEKARQRNEDRRTARDVAGDARGDARDARGDARDARGDARDARGDARDAAGDARDARGDARDAARDARGDARDAHGESDDEDDEDEDD